NMNSDGYIDVLAKHFVPWANSLLEQYPDEINLVFQQDLARVHTSTDSEWWMKSYGFDILDWAPYSPDLNPIENLWERVNSVLRNRRPAPKTQEELVKCIKEEWNKIQIVYIRSLIC
ncbi:4269_t:CDS:1, partial [Dentiscutata heterogama]